MKNTLILNFLLISLVSVAQKNNYGFIIGQNYSHYLTYHVGQMYTTQTLPASGFVVGAYFNHSIKNKYKIQTGLNWIVKNSKFQILAPSPNINELPTGETKNAYVQIPFTLAYSKNKKFDFFSGVFLGLAFGNYYNKAPNYIGIHDPRMGPEYFNWDNGLQIGTTYKIGHFRINFDFSRTLSTNVIINRKKHHFNTFSLSLIYLIKKQQL